jgi:TolB-like protein/DNA-binding winged helix-turn-helix (wHTH) protein/cytochrome c-type biogenesis protein CcmH/NrfG
VPSPVVSRVLRFGVFEADLHARELRKQGMQIKLQEQPFQILAFLLEHPGEIVTREQLRQKLWPGDTFVDVNNSVNAAINRLRDALGDSAESPRFVETLPRRGYRFVAPITEIKGPERDSADENADTVIPARPEESPAIGKLKVSRTIAKLSLAVTLVVILVAASIWAWQKWRARMSLQTTPHITSLVVLPLTNLSGDPSQDYFADGMTDELTTDLARISSLKVISETSAMRYRGTHPPLQQIAQELDVDAVIEGSVARSGNQVRITAQLIDVKNDRHVWAQSYDRHGIDVLGLQRDVALSITNQIHLKLTPAEASRLETLPTHNQQAYDAYLHAKYHVYSAFAVEADANAAIAEAEQAITLDPDFAEAYVVIAQGCFAKIFDWAGGKEYDEKAVVALGNALTLDPNLADAYATRGALSYTRLHSFDIVSAVADYRRAISLNPNLAEAHQNLGAELTHVGLHDQAIEEFRMTLRLDPKNDGAKYRLGRALWQSQRFGEALENYDRYNIVSFEKALTLAYLGRRQQAWETIEGVAQQLGRARRGGFGGDPEDVAAVRAFLYATEAKPQKAEREIQVAAHLGRDNDHFHHAAFILAAACAEMGKPHEAVAWLSRVAGTGMPNYPLFRDNLSMSKLRGNSEFEEFMARLKPRWDQLAASL